MTTLAQQKTALLEKWLERTLATYPHQTQRFLQAEKDRFRNPVGHTLKEGLAALVDELTGQMDLARIGPALESIVRVRAVQDFTPSQAVGFVYLLREVLDEEIEGGGSPAVQRRIDELALHAFDLYMHCREEIFAIKAREAQKKVYVLERLHQRTLAETVRDQSPEGFGPQDKPRLRTKSGESAGRGTSRTAPTESGECA